MATLIRVFSWRTKDEIAILPSVDESRKRVILIAASILAARKLAQYDADKRVPATMCAIADAVRWAEAILKEIEVVVPFPQQPKIAEARFSKPMWSRRLP